MSVIGEYIHLTAAGYNEYGVYRKTKDKAKFDFATATNIEIGKTQKSIKHGINVTNLETELNQFFINRQNKTSSNSDVEIFNAIKTQLDEQFRRVGQITDTGDVRNTEEILNKSIAGLTETIKRNNKQRLNPSLVKDKINRLNNIMTELARKNEQGLTLEEVQSQTRELETLYRDLYGSLSKSVSIPNGTKGILKKEATLKDKINKLIKLYAAYPPINLEKGEFMEYLVAYIGGRMNKMAIQEITANMEDLKIGGKNETFKMNPELFGVLKEGAVNEYDTILLDKAIEIQQSQYKVDVIVKLNGNDVNASVKNVKFDSIGKGYIHTVSGSNLLFYLQDIAPDLVNHYLNLNAAHNTKTYIEHLKSKDKINNSERNDSRRAMQIIIAARSLTGNVLGRKTADIFIVNDNTTGKVRIITMEKLVNAINSAKSFGKLSVNIDNKSIYSDSYKFINDRDSSDITGIKRISKLINSLRKIKLETGISKNFFIDAYNE